jgi:hypothetical protein
MSDIVCTEGFFDLRMKESNTRKVWEWILQRKFSRYIYIYTESSIVELEVMVKRPDERLPEVVLLPYPVPTSSNAETNQVVIRVRPMAQVIAINKKILAETKLKEDAA